MKIKPSDYKDLESLCIATLKRHRMHPYMVQNKETAWNVFHKTCDHNPKLLNKLYKYLNDNHIETALKKMFKT